MNCPQNGTAVLKGLKRLKLRCGLLPYRHETTSIYLVGNSARLLIPRAQLSICIVWNLTIIPGQRRVVSVHGPTPLFADSCADSGTVDFTKFAASFGKLPAHDSDKAGRANNFLPKHAVEYDINAIEKKIIHKLEGGCEVRANSTLLDALVMRSNIVICQAKIKCRCLVGL